MITHDPARLRASALAMIVVLLAPLLLLGPCLLGSRLFVPFDLAQWPPISTMLTPEQLAQVTAEQNTDISEIPFTFVPELRYTQQELAAGRLPQWNPYVRGGAPLLATSVVGLLYPLNWICLVLGDPQHGLAVVAYLGLAIAGFLTYRLLRRLHLHPPAALFGALAFMFSGTLYANAHFYQRLHALIWLPGMLWGILRTAQAVGHGRVPGIVALALSMAMTWLAGFPPYAAAAALVAAVYGLVWVVRELRDSGAAAELRLAGCLAGGAALGLAVACVQLLPMFAFFPESSRTIAPGVDSLSTQNFDLAGLLGYVMPSPFGHPTRTSILPYEQSPLVWALFDQSSLLTGQAFLPRYNFTEYTVFPGTLTLFLAIAGICSRGLRFKTFAVGTFLLLFVLALAPRALALVYSIPGVQNVPPVRYVGPLALLIATLAAMGLEYAPRAMGARAWYGLWIGGTLAAGLCFAGYAWVHAQTAAELFDRIAPDIVAHYKPSHPAASIELLRDQYIGPYMAAGRSQLLSNLAYAGIALLLGAAWIAVLPWASATATRLRVIRLLAIVGTTVQLAWLAVPVSGGREMPFSHNTPVHDFLLQQRARHQAQGGFTVARATAGAATLPLLLPPCSLVPERIRDLNAYTFLDGRSHQPWQRLYGQGQMFHEYYLNSLPDDERLAHPLLDLFGVRFLLSAQPLQRAGTRVGPQLEGPGGRFFIYERPHPLPRAFVVPKLTVLADDEAVLDAMVAPLLDPRASALITAADAASIDPTAGGQGAGARTVVFRQDRPDEPVLQVAPGDPGFLVISDTFMSGWSVTVNDAAQPLLRVNHCMRAIALPANGVEVRMRYATPGLSVGIRITFGALFVLGVLLLSFLTSRRRGRRSEDTL